MNTNNHSEFTSRVSPVELFCRVSTSRWSDPLQETTCVQVCTSMLSMASIWLIRYDDMVASSDGPLTSICTRLAWLLK